MAQKVLGICGLIGSGKDTVGDYLVDIHDYTRLSFAMVLKDMLAVVFNWDRELLEGSTPESRAWRDKEDLWWTIRFGKKWTPRIAMQEIGTDLFRNHFFENIWISTVENKMRDLDKVVFTDVRFPNEIDFVKKVGSLWQVNRGDKPDWVAYAEHYNTTIVETRNSISPYEKYGVHESEWAWVGLANADHLITNNNTIEDLYSVVNNLV